MTSKTGCVCLVKNVCLQKRAVTVTIWPIKGNYDKIFSNVECEISVDGYCAVTL